MRKSTSRHPQVDRQRVDDSPLFDVQLRLSPDEESNGSCPSGATTCVVIVSGELDLATAPELDRILAKAIRSHCREVLVDMTRVEFIDAAGVGALVSGARGAVTAGAHFHLRAASPSVEKVLRLVGLDEAIETAFRPVGRSGAS